MSVPDPSLLPAGRVFHGHYEIVRCINAGAMGAVYEVLDKKTLRRRALKVMLPSLIADQELRARFRLEATVTANIESEHIVETFDADVDAETGSPFLVMELLRGEDLSRVLAARGRLPPSEAVALLAQVARALNKTHAAGIVHRDLKPENLFLTHRDDGTPRVKVLDFGIAKVAAQSAHVNNTTRNIGTPPFMSPEQIAGENITPRSDLYALAHIAYALLVGEPYWLEEARASEAVYPLLIKIMQGAKEPATSRAVRRGVALPPGFEGWFAKATAPLPADRFNTATELVAALAVALGIAVQASSSSVGEWSFIGDRASLLSGARPVPPPSTPGMYPPGAPGAHSPSSPGTYPPSAPGFYPSSSSSAPPAPSFGVPMNIATGAAVSSTIPSRKPPPVALWVLGGVLVIGIGLGALVAFQWGSPGAPMSEGDGAAESASPRPGAPDPAASSASAAPTSSTAPSASAEAMPGAQPSTSAPVKPAPARPASAAPATRPPPRPFVPRAPPKKSPGYDPLKDL